jgi:hypothetical protein
MTGVAPEADNRVQSDGPCPAWAGGVGRMQGQRTDVTIGGINRLAGDSV